MEEMIKRINELAKKKREEGLTPEETQEQQALYKKYLAGFRNNLKAQIENTDVKYADGKVVPLKDVNKK
jgi:uncharacterized protein YnzC (UPF0291/DUF896 family)